MDNYLSFAGGISLSDLESSYSEEELNVTQLALEEKPEVQFNNSDVVAESLTTAPISAPEASRKQLRDIAPDGEELIEGIGLFIKCPQIPGCPDTRKWILKNMSPANLQNLDVWDQYTESIRFSIGCTSVDGV